MTDYKNFDKIILGEYSKLHIAEFPFADINPIQSSNEYSFRCSNPCPLRKYVPNFNILSVFANNFLEF